MPTGTVVLALDPLPLLVVIEKPPRPGTFEVKANVPSAPLATLVTVIEPGVAAFTTWQRQVLPSATVSWAGSTVSTAPVPRSSHEAESTTNPGAGSSTTR